MAVLLITSLCFCAYDSAISGRIIPVGGEESYSYPMQIQGRRFMKNKKCRWKNSRVSVMALVLTLLFSLFSLPADDKEALEDYIVAKGKYKVEAYKDAVASYIEYLKKYPRHKNSAAARFELGLCYFELKDYGAAARELEKAASRKVNDQVRVNLFLIDECLFRE